MYVPCLREAGSAGSPAPGLMLKDEGIEDGLGDLLLVGTELGKRLELKTEVFVGSALVLAKDEFIGRDP